MIEWQVGDRIVILNVDDPQCLNEMSLELVDASTNDSGYLFKNGDRFIRAERSKEAKYLFDVMSVCFAK